MSISLLQLSRGEGEHCTCNQLDPRQGRLSREVGRLCVPRTIEQGRSYSVGGNEQVEHVGRL